jgi:hypothetical protein
MFSFAPPILSNVVEGTPVLLQDTFLGSGSLVGRNTETPSSGTTWLRYSPGDNSGVVSGGRANNSSGNDVGCSVVCSTSLGTDTFTMDVTFSLSSTASNNYVALFVRTQQVTNATLGIWCRLSGNGTVEYWDTPSFTNLRTDTAAATVTANTEATATLTVTPTTIQLSIPAFSYTGATLTTSLYNTQMGAGFSLPTSGSFGTTYVTDITIT